MKKIITAALLLSSACATAANAGYGHEGKAYTKLDLGYGVQDKKQTVTGDLTAKGESMGDGIYAGAGLGYYFLDEIRVDGMIYYDRGYKNKKNDTANNVTLKGVEQSFGVLGNVYYDFLNQTNVTPYVMLGAGFLRNNFKTEIIESGAAPKKENKSSFDIAYQGGAGISYHMSSSLDLDFGYRYLNKGSKDYKMTIGGINVKAETSPAHIALIGLRNTF